jgi:hypothetical protein
LILEVENGGFYQYFCNQTGPHAESAAEALKAIYASKSSELTRLAINVAFPNGLPSDPQKLEVEAWNLPEDVRDELDKISRKFFEQSPSLHADLLSFVKMHPNEIGLLDVSECD